MAGRKCVRFARPEIDLGRGLRRSGQIGHLIVKGIAARELAENYASI